MAAGGAVTGMRAGLMARCATCMTPRRRRVVTGLLIASGVLGAGLIPSA